MRLAMAGQLSLQLAPILVLLLVRCRTALRVPAVQLGGAGVLVALNLIGGRLSRLRLLLQAKGLDQQRFGDVRGM